MKKLILILAVMAIPVVAVMTVSAMAQDHSAIVDSWLKPVEAKYVCMVNNKVFDKVQIPVDVEGQTYYGCCSMCKARLEKVVELRQDTDPVSGKMVDKATAAIGATPEGVVYYFENEENLKAFKAPEEKESSELM